MIVKVGLGQVKDASLHLYRQVLACAAISLLSLCGGFTVGFSAVLLPQLQEDESYSHDVENESWIASAAPLFSALGCAVAGVILDGIGSRLTNIIMIWPFIFGWLIHAFANTLTLHLVARIVIGFCLGLLRSTHLVYLGEISAPKYRGMMLFCMSVFGNLGILICHVVGGYTTWKTSSLAYATIPIMSFILLIFLKESPFWFLSKGKTELGRESFEWFRGNSEASQKELAAAMETLKDKSQKLKFKEFLRIMFSRVFMKPLAAVILIFVALQFSGFNTFAYYGQDLLKETFPDKIDPFWFLILNDGLRVLSSVSLLLLSNRVSRRKIFLLTNLLTGVFLLFVVMFMTIDVADFIWLQVACMILFILFGSAMTSTGWTFTSEIFPNSHRGFGSGISGTLSFFLSFIAIKITPGIVSNFGIIVLYCGNAITVFSCMIAIYFLLPETNGKTLQEIEENYSR